MEEIGSCAVKYGLHNESAQVMFLYDLYSSK